MFDSCTCAAGYTGNLCENQVDCLDLSATAPLNVSTDMTTFGGTATYTCDAGYDLNGSASRTCQMDATWSGAAPTCDIRSCPTLANPANGSVAAATLTFGSTATYSCDTGYALSGGATRMCQSDATWSGAAPTCQIVDCGAAPTAPRTAARPAPARPTTRPLSYACDTGYTLSGATSVTCLDTGAWSDVAHTCTIVDCGAPPMPADGSASATTTTYLSTATYSCDTGFTLNGVSSRTCQDDGSWSDTTPTCESVLCPRSRRAHERQR